MRIDICGWAEISLTINKSL